MEPIIKPYSDHMALNPGDELEPFFFQPEVLERYRNNPLYIFSNDEISCMISIPDEIDEGNSFQEKDKIHIQFGFGYNEDLSQRMVTAFLCDLDRISPEHQLYWKSFEIEKDGWFVHPDYYRSQILGEFYKRIPIIEAFFEEIKIINKMCDLMERPHLFRKQIEFHDRPRNFSLIIRPTTKEFYDFVLELDKFMSENLDKKFLRNEISDLDNENRKKGTIQLLEEWLNKNFSLAPDQLTLNEMVIEPFKKVRKERQIPAHKIQNNEQNIKLYIEQRQLLRDAYSSIRSLRLIFANHESCKDFEIPEWLYDGRIWDF